MTPPDNAVRILGVDPGFGKLGVAKLLFSPGRGTWLEGLHLISTKASSKKRNMRVKADDLRRLIEIEQQFSEIVRHWPCDVVSFEESPSIKPNPRSTRIVALAWGACHAIATQKEGVLSFEYDPKILKKAITGENSASKAQMIAELSKRYSKLKDSKIPKTHKEHVADAIAACVVATQDPAVINLGQALRRMSSS